MPNFQTVPWFDALEWLRVYSALFSPTATAASKRAALCTLLAWKARQSNLVSGVESTLSLLEVEAQAEDGSTCERVLRLAYSAALTRFVNHMLDSEQARGLTLYHAARRAALPDWVIDLRHSAAHGGSLPSYDLLKRATRVALDWLHRNYWDPQKESIANYAVGAQDISRDDEERLSRMLTFCASLSICSRVEPPIKKLSDIPDEDMRESILQEARELLDVNFADANVVTMTDLVHALSSHLSKLLKCKDASAIVKQTLLDSNSLFLSLEVLSLFDEKLFSKNGLSKQYVASWEVLLIFIQTSNLLPAFVQDLVAVSEDEERPDNVRKLAALWTREILRAMRRTHIYIQKLQKLSQSGKLPGNFSKKKKHKLFFKELFPNEQRGLTLNLIQPVAEQFRNFAFIRPIIMSCNPHLVIFIRDLFALLEPKLGSEKEEKWFKIATVVAGKQLHGNTIEKMDKVYTLEDVLRENGTVGDNKPDKNDSDCMAVDVCEESDEEGKWKLAKGDYDWSKCPLGVLPWQIQTPAV